jgi:hypothetical protein
MASPKTVTVDVGQLHFYRQNPRHDPLSDEPLIIKRLYGPERVLALIKHISANGMSPLDRIALVKHETLKDGFTVVEGNRRLCALKLLKDPAKVANPAAERAIRSAKLAGIPMPKKLEAVLFTDRAEARVWMKLRHEGEQNGAGTKKWNAKQITRHNSEEDQPTSPNAQSQALLDYAFGRGLIDANARDAIAITTITRFLTNPVFRNMLGLVNGKTLEILVDQSEFDIAVTRFLNDAARGNEGPVTSRTKSADRESYAEKLRSDDVAPKTRLEEAVVPKAQASVSATPRARRNSRSPDHRAHVVPTTFKVTIRDVVLKRIFDELKEIDPDEFAFSAGYLLRAFVEQTSVLYAKKYALGHQVELHVVIERCVTHLEKTITDRKVIKPLREMSSDKNSRLSPDSLGAWVHGSVIPTGAELKRRWDTIEAGFRLLIDAL